MNPANSQVILALAEGLIYLLCASVAFWRREYHPRAARIAFVYCLLSFLWILEQAFWRSGRLSFLAARFQQWAPIYGIVALAFLFLLLSRAILNLQGAGRGWWLVGMLWMACEILFGLNPIRWPDILFFANGWAFLRLGVVWWLSISGYFIFMIGAVVTTFRVLIRKERTYTIASYWSIVALLTLFGGVFFLVRDQAWGNVLCLLGACLATYVLSMPRLANLSHIARRSLSYLIFAVLAVLIYATGIAVMDAFFQGWSRFSPMWAGLILALVLVFLFNPLLTLIRKWTNQWVFGSKEDPTNLLRKYSQSITNILNLKLLANVSVATAGELLGVDRGDLFLVNIEKDCDNRKEFMLYGVKGMGEANPEPGHLAEESLLTGYFRQERQPLTHAEVEFQPRFREIPSEERAWLDGLDMEVYVPIHAKDEWIGLLALGSKGSGEAYSEADLLLLSTLANQTAVALENTRLVEGLMRLNNDFRRAYAALDHANRRLERLDRTKSDFISVASHELLTPLTLISGACQMLLEESKTQQNAYQQELLSKINRGSERLQEIVDDMLEIAKIDTRVLKLETQPVSIYDLITGVHIDLKGAARSRKQTIEIQNLRGLPAVAADLDALHKVFYHLIINAIKYTPDGGNITVSGCEVPPDVVDLPCGGVEIVVSDTGIGIDPAYQELIFVKFYQTGEIALHSSGKTKFKGGGAGLGLAIARGVVEAHQGKIWVESPGYDEVKCPGSKFHVVLPIRQMQRPAAPRKLPDSIAN